MPDDEAHSYSHMTATYSPRITSSAYPHLPDSIKRLIPASGKRVLSGHRNRKFS